MIGSKIHFQRGQVWYVDDNYIPQGSIQGKSRPYLVVSNDACNRFSPVIHMAPITSQHKKANQPTHVSFFNPRSKQDNWILLEQAMPKSVPDIVDVSTYWFTLSKETMDEVNKALAIQFALKSFGIDISDFETMLDMIVEQKIAQISDATQSLLDARMSKYVDALVNRVADAGKIPEPEDYTPGPEVLQKMQEAPKGTLEEDRKIEVVPPIVIPQPEVKSEIKPEVKPQPAKQERPKSAIDRFNAKWSQGNTAKAPEAKPEVKPEVKEEKPNVNQITRPEITRTKSGRVKWNDELKKQFIIDCNSYGPKKVCSIWGLEQRSLYAYRYKFVKELVQKGIISELDAKIASPRERATQKVKKEATAETPKVEKVITQAPVTQADILKDYDSMPLSKFMNKYGIATKAQAVEVAARLRLG
ncbi:MAG: type II toxin-antitoxin system PemK/MazF family toxin [Lachnospiraceae bacterium]|nr:type II toxin-antitoxin system PemK/MazF family toxin [Lachnospiraceae bacterium]MCM1237551.1 type II toxin-antitoxin system PemK/MazF family toxin [Ruminococcus flavefaciens]